MPDQPCDRCGKESRLTPYHDAAFFRAVRWLTRQKQWRQLCWRCHRDLGPYADAPLAHEPQLQEGFDEVWLKAEQEREAKAWAESKTALGWLFAVLGGIAFLLPWPVIIGAYLHRIPAPWLFAGPAFAFAVTMLACRAISSQPGNVLIRRGQYLAVAAMFTVLPALFVVPYALGV